MTTEDVAEALEDWAASLVTGLTAHHEAPDDLTEDFPIALCEVKTTRRAATDPEFPQRGYEQSAVQVWVADLLLLVAPEAGATEQLYEIVDALAEGLRDRTLGGRVQFASPFFDADFERVTEYPSGTVAKTAALTVTVGEETPG